MGGNRNRGASSLNCKRTATKSQSTIFVNILAASVSLSLPLSLSNHVQEEEFAELLLAYFFIATSPGPLSAKGLGILVEDFLLETFRFRAKIDVDDAVAKLEEFGLLQDGRYDLQLRQNVITVVPLRSAVQQLQDLSLSGAISLQQGFRQRTNAEGAATSPAA